MTTNSFLEPLRSWMIALTVLFLGFAWYRQLTPKKEIDCECEALVQAINSTGFKVAE